jgi:hypothetical protein
MTFHRQFDNIYDAGALWDTISRQPQTCAAMLFFRRTSGTYGGGPFWVWSSEEGEARHMARAMPIRNVAREDMADRVLLRNAFANWRAAMRRNTPAFRPTGHAEEFMVQDFQGCLAAAGSVDRAHISITWSPCIGELDSKASANFGAARGCYSKLLLLAARHKNLEFVVSFKVGFGHFTNNGDGAETYLNTHRLTPNITFHFAPTTG